MTTIDTSLFQNDLFERLKKLFPDSCVVTKEWPAFTRDSLIYSPRIDIAIGPYTYEEEQIRYYNQLYDDKIEFIKECYEKHIENMNQYSNSFSPNMSINVIESFNPHPVCFMAIEIEKSGSRKHLLGSIINVSVLSKIGIIVSWEAKLLEALIKQMDYLDFTSGTMANNVFILTRRQFHQIICKNIWRQSEKKLRRNFLKRRSGRGGRSQEIR